MGEHTTEARVVGGSIPSLPIFKMVQEAVTIILSFILGYAIDGSWAWLLRKVPSGKKGEKYIKIIIRKIRIHHNIFGYVLIALGFFYYPLIFVPAGIGMIVGHRIRDELFWFLETVEKDTKRIKEEVKQDKKAVRRNQIKL